MVDRDAVGFEGECLFDRALPRLERLANHAGNQIDVGVWEVGGLDPVPGPEDFGREVGPAVRLQDHVIEVLHAEGDAGHPQGLERLDLRLGERARFALKGHLLGVVPAKTPVEAGHESFELLDGQKRGSAATKVDIAERAAGHGGAGGCQGRLVGERVGIALDIRRCDVCVDTEVAELAPLSAEGHVEIQPQGRSGGRCVKGSQHVGHRGLRPARERRIVGDEVAARLGGFTHGGSVMLGEVARVTDRSRSNTIARMCRPPVGRHDRRRRECPCGRHVRARGRRADRRNPAGDSLPSSGRARGRDRGARSPCRRGRSCHRIGPLPGHGVRDPRILPESPAA